MSEGLRKEIVPRKEGVRQVTFRKSSNLKAYGVVRERTLMEAKKEVVSPRWMSVHVNTKAYMYSSAWAKEFSCSEADSRVLSKVSMSTSRIVPLAAKWRRNRALALI